MAKEKRDGEAGEPAKPIKEQKIKYSADFACPRSGHKIEYSYEEKEWVCSDAICAWSEPATYPNA